jgi:hypothetical protein
MVELMEMRLDVISTEAGRTAASTGNGPSLIYCGLALSSGCSENTNQHPLEPCNRLPTNPL